MKFTCLLAPPALLAVATAPSTAPRGHARSGSPNGPTPISLSAGIPTNFPGAKVPCETHFRIISTPPPTAGLSTSPRFDSSPLAVSRGERPQSAGKFGWSTLTMRRPFLGILAGSSHRPTLRRHSDLLNALANCLPVASPGGDKPPGSVRPCLWALPPEMLLAPRFRGPNIKNLGYARLHFFRGFFAVAGFLVTDFYG